MFCRLLKVSRQGFYNYLNNRNRPWKYQLLADAMMEILAEDEYNDTYGRDRMHKALLKKNPEGVDPETVLYEVQCDDGDPEVPGSLSYGLTTIYPNRINGECPFTKGHWHMDETVEEVYEGESGTGLLMYMNHDGMTWCEKVFPGSVHHIAGTLAHRLINTGDVPLKVRAVWPPSAGHNYDEVTAHPFGFRVYRNGDEIKVTAHE